MVKGLFTWKYEGKVSEQVVLKKGGVWGGGGPW